MRTRRVGSITCGVVLILFGVLFLLHMVMPALTYDFIFRLWPLILVFLGAEILLSNLKKTKEAMKYDGGAILLIIVLAFFSMIMGAAEFAMANAPICYYW